MVIAGQLPKEPWWKRLRIPSSIIVVGSSWSDMCFNCRRTTTRLHRPEVMSIYFRRSNERECLSLEDLWCFLSESKFRELILSLLFFVPGRCFQVYVSSWIQYDSPFFLLSLRSLIGFWQCLWVVLNHVVVLLIVHTQATDLRWSTLYCLRGKWYNGAKD